MISTVLVLIVKNKCGKLSCKSATLVLNLCILNCWVILEKKGQNHILRIQITNLVIQQTCLFLLKCNTAKLKRPVYLWPFLYLSTHYNPVLLYSRHPPGGRVGNIFTWMSLTWVQSRVRGYIVTQMITIMAVPCYLIPMARKITLETLVISKQLKLPGQNMIVPV